MLVKLDMTADAVAHHEPGLSPRPDGPSGPSSATSAPRDSLFSLPFRLMTTTKRERQPSPSAVSVSHPPAPSSASVSASPISSRRGSIEGVTALGTDKNRAATTTTTTTPSSPSTAAAAQKPSTRPKTSFVFAHPPPSTRPRRLRIRPKLLLQLHQVSHTSRPVPALDVIPSALFGPVPVKRRVSNSVRNKERPSTTDLIVVPSDRYDSMAAAPADDDNRSISSQEEEGREQRKVLATLRQTFREAGRTDPTVDIHLDNGASWKVSSLPQGGYEFSSENEHGVTQRIRWVARAKGNNRHSGVGGASPSDEGHKRFTFSIIDPRTRRHPVIAWMTRQGLDILDQYSLSAGSGDGQTAAAAAAAETPAPTIADTDENLRTLIIATGIWTAFREGWSQNPLSCDGPGPVSSATNTPVSSPHPQSSSSTPQPNTESSNGAERKSKDKGNRLSGLQNVGARFLSGTILQRTHSSTEESWKTAKSTSGLGESISNSNTAPAAEQTSAVLNRGHAESSDVKTDGDDGDHRPSSHHGRENQPPPPDSFESTRDLKACSNGHLKPTTTTTTAGTTSKKGLRRLSALLGKKKKPSR